MKIRYLSRLIMYLIFWLPAVGQEGGVVSNPFAAADSLGQQLISNPNDLTLQRRLLGIDRLEAAFPGISMGVSERIAASQDRYRRKLKSGLSTGQVARAVNRLATELDLPPYAYTDAAEVREVRGKLLQATPNLMQPVNIQAKTPSKSTPVEYDLTPIQAAFLALTLVDQKLTNPDFEFTFAERRALKKRHQESKPRQRAAGTEERHEVVVRTESARQEKLRKSLEAKVRTSSGEELNRLLHKALSELGVE